ncbi:MAG TPA: CPBP family intramembrane glutamic endopeptidase [Anaeromyxobacter sp.]|nr:CPBP family intramembrane glutamic endopeptidase [Anaeromyxobacter sp.]
MGWLELPALKWFLPLPVLALLAWPIWRFFRRSWAELEAEALERRRARPAGSIDWRPPLAAVAGFTVLALQYYHGTPDYFSAHVRRPLLSALGWLCGGPVDQSRWGELAWQGWWGFTRVGGYLLPVVAWRFLVPGARLGELGLRGKGFREHLWIYALCLTVMVPVLHLAQRQPDFGAYYPFYRQAGRSWVDFLAWEGIYLAQFFALELFFRGWWIGTSRSLGVGAIFAVTVPYACIHLGKPYFEALGALVAGVVLGSLAVLTRSIWAGFLVHSTIALLMDVAALKARHSLPRLLAPGSARSLELPVWAALPWLAWGAAVAVLVLEVRRRRVRRAARAGPAPLGSG